MYSLQTVFLTIVALYYVITRGFPRLLSWFIVAKYQTEIKIGRISLLRLSFEDVLIKKSGLSIKVDRVGATSSLFNQEERKIFAIKVHDVRIEKEVCDKRRRGTRTETVNNTSMESAYSAAGADNSSTPVEPHVIKLRISPSVVTLAQFFGVHIMSVSVMYLREKWPECLLHASAEKITLEGATLNQSNVALKVSISGAHFKVLQHVSEGDVKSAVRGTACAGQNQDPSLIECAISLKLSIEANAETVAAMENISVHLCRPQVTIRERLFTFLEHNAQASTPIINPSALSTKNNTSVHNLLHRFWLFLPLKFQVKVEDIGIRLMNNLSQMALQGSLVGIDLQTHLNREGGLENLPALLPDFSTELQVDNTRLQCIHDSSIFLNRFNLQTQFVGDRVNMKSEFRSLHLLYDHRDLGLWTTYMSRQKPLPPALCYVQESRNKEKSGAWKILLHRYCIGMIVEMWDVSCGGSVPGSSYGQTSLQHARFSAAVSQWTSQVAGELILESLVSTLGQVQHSIAPAVLPVSATTAPRRIHVWGTPACIGLCLLQLSSVPASSGRSNNCLPPLQAEALVDNMQLEWSPELGSFITSLVRYSQELKKYPRIITTQKVAHEMPIASEETFNSISVKCTNINMFAVTEHKVSLMVRVDSLESQKSAKNSKTTIVGTKLLRFVPSGAQYSCIKSSEIKGECGQVSEVVVEMINGELLIDISEQLHLTWSTTTHMTLLTLTQELASFHMDVKPVPENEEGSGVVTNKEEAEEQTGLQLQLIARGDIRVGAELSKRHQMFFILGDLTYLMANGRISCQSEELQIHFDEHKVMCLTGGKLSRALQSREIREERESMPELSQKHNKAWKLTVDTWKLTFSYEFNFADAFSDDLLSVIKWIKLVHNHQPKIFTAASLLPPDVVIRVRRWLMEIGDDPFEVKLRYNYELLEDEYQESCKRLKALDARIDELRKTMFLFPTGKIEELYKNLQEKNSETYIKRSKLMYESAPMRTQLFTWTMEDVVIFAMADPSFHGTDRVVQHMVDIDPESPWPEEGQEFSTLWCRMVSASCAEWKFRLRDYPQSLLHMKDLELWGRLIGAEQKARKRAIRNVKVEVGTPWSDVTVERTMSALKFYHDFSCEVKTFTAAYGPCWEPAVAQFNIALSLINQPSRDPSMPLPWWDKMRLLFHGRLTLMVERMTLLLHASLDPYNTTEEMELTWTNLTMDWTNAKLIFKGELNVFVRTASKYDDARLLHLPNLKLTVKMNWQCHGNPNDHHSVMLCAPDKLPEYSSNQEHDSYRAFRSQHLNMNIVLETKTMKKNDAIVNPVIEALFYGSTLRWFENLKFILSGVARPTRRGPLFNNTKARKPQLSRHYNTIHLSISFQRFDVRYWMSVGVKKGFHLSGERLSLSSEHNLALIPVNDGLRHRPRSCWSIVFLNTELCHAQIRLQSVLKDYTCFPNEEQQEPLSQPVEKFYFLNVSKVAYMRETLTSTPSGTSHDPDQRDTPNHRLVVYGLKGAWTTNNRDIVLALYDSWTKSQQLRRNLTPDIIKNYNPEASTPQKPRSRSLTDGNTSQSLTSPTAALQVPPVQATPSPMSRLQSGHAQAMLQQLIAEADNNQVAFSEDCSNTEPRDQTLHGVKACTTDDVIHKRWLIELVNSQVLLKGCETQGYVILSAAKAQILQRIHRPVWQDHSLVTKTTWFGSLECMQYYATVNAGDKETQMDNIMWLTVDNIEEKDGQVINEVADIVGSGQSVGGVVSQTVGSMDESDDEHQLQRIVSRCHCEFYYVSYGETGLDLSLMEEVQPPLPEDDLWNRNVEAVDTFTLMHHDLCASTNSLQYNMVVDILNNLLLYVDPMKKEATEAVARMRFQLQLYSRDDQRKPIIRLQNQVRYHLSQLRSLEKEVYLVQRQLDKDPSNEQKRKEKLDLEEQVSECKEQVNSLSEELAMRIHCYNENQLSANHKWMALGGDKQVKVIRMNEVCFRKAQWRLTEADGQLGIADLVLSNFLYTKKTNADDSGEHLLELGFVTMRNLLPNQPYQEVLMPAELQLNMPVDRQRTLRIFCREKPPCGGISIIEHFEINVVPLNIALTYQFFKTMMKFCFPDNATEEEFSGGDITTNQNTRGSKKQASLRKSHKESSFYVSLQDKDDVEIMKQRAEQNKLFVYIKIPELPVRVSYKGKKEKNLEDVSNFRLVVPTLEYHNVTWTWLDFLMAMKQDSKSALLSQAIKHKLNLSHFRADDASMPNEEEKARLLLGSKLMPPESKGTKKSLFKFNR
ncbi:protein hobbit [Procambarus clarkii]|uniref:protein hobbit n=1 Tax=Procambarus clarkii TaxID=6728 RepID=UPI001E678EA9|nr:protein KIAA0100-like [Procambarus clarkii]